jgi:tRNA modification GTPase
VSALRGTGLRELVEDLQEMLAQGTAPIGLDMPVITNARHRRALERALEEVEQFAAARRDRGLPATIAAVHLRSAAGALEELIGGVDVEDILTRVFSAFCVGK